MASKYPEYHFGLLETPGGNDFPMCDVEPGSSARTVCDNMGSKASCYSNSPSQLSMQTPYSFQGFGSVQRLGLVDNSHATSTIPGTSSTSGCSRAPNKIYQTATGPKRIVNSSSSATPASDGSSLIMAVVEGRGLAKGEIGMASIDLKQPELMLSQFADNHTYGRLMTRLNVLQPVEIVLPSTAYESGNKSTLMETVTANFPKAHVTTVSRKYFNEEKGLQYMKNLCLPEYNTVELTVKSKYYCLATINALMRYIEVIRHISFAPASLKIDFRGSEQTTMIDVTTVANLELLRNAREPRSHNSLFGIINHTKTRMGARLLRANILQPPRDLETINLRLDVIDELTKKEALFIGLQSVISRFIDIDHILSMCVQIPKEESVKTADNVITAVISLKHTVELAETLRATLINGNTESVLLKHYEKNLTDPSYASIANCIGEVVHDDTRYTKGRLSMHTQKCFLIKPGINGLLDVARRTYQEIMQDINELVRQIAEKYGLPLKNSFSALRGFHIQLTTNAQDNITVDNLPAEFVKVTKTKSTFSFTTAEMIKMNDRVKESLNEIYIMSSGVLSELMTEIRQHLGCLYKLADCVAMLDMLVCFAHNCTVSTYTRPEFTDTLAIKNGRHPILDKIAFETPVPNNTYAAEENTFIILTGPNMSGKSTYLRQIALLQVMAQIGSFVPADYASFRIADQIFSRIGSDDDIETNSSTFTVEMREITYIIQHATDSSLIIIDELGRGTHCDEGFAICHAICEHLQSLKAFTFFATHFIDLTNLAALYPNIENYHFEVQHIWSDESQSDKIRYTHVLSRGKTEERHYGLRLAEVSALPVEVIKDAVLISQQLSDQRKKNQTLTAEAVRQRAVFKLAKQLEQTAIHSRLDRESLRVHLKSLRDQFVAECQAVTSTANSSSTNTVEQLNTGI